MLVGLPGSGQRWGEARVVVLSITLFPPTTKIVTFASIVFVSTFLSLQVIHACWQSNSNGMGVWDSFWHLLSVNQPEAGWAIQVVWECGILSGIYSLLPTRGRLASLITERVPCSPFLLNTQYTHLSFVFPLQNPDPLDSDLLQFVFPLNIVWRTLSKTAHAARLLVILWMYLIYMALKFC